MVEQDSKKIHEIIESEELDSSADEYSLYHREEQTFALKVREADLVVENVEIQISNTSRGDIQDKQLNSDYKITVD